MVDRIEVNVIEQPQPRWLSFVNREMDIIEAGARGVHERPRSRTTSSRRTSPSSASTLCATCATTSGASYFSMDDPGRRWLFGAEGRAAPRRSPLGVDVEREIQAVRRGQAIPAQSIVGPNVWGYDPGVQERDGRVQPREGAGACSTLNGYVDPQRRWLARTNPTASPLLIEYATQPDDLNRQIITQWKKNMDAIGIRIVFRTAQWPEKPEGGLVSAS